MKISEVRDVIQKHSQDRLRAIIVELYKAVPKAVKEKNDVDALLKDPDGARKSKREKKEAELPDIGLLNDETTRFIEDAYADYYFAPNRFIPKSERPKWRFIVKRLYKDLLLAARGDDVAEAAQLLEKLYQLLCYSCRQTLFNTDDPFQSVGIAQKEFFRKVLSLKYQYEDKSTFLKNALLLFVDGSLNWYSLHEDLTEVVLEFARTPDLKEMTIARCNELLEMVRRERPSKKDAWRSDLEYQKQRKLNNLATMGFLCYAHLYEYENAIAYFKANYGETDREVILYVLLGLLFRLNQKDHFLREYEKAVESGVAPRKGLTEVYRLTKEKGELPARFW